MSSSGKVLMSWIALGVAVLVSVAFVMTTDPEAQAVHAAESAGLTEVNVEGWAWFGCGEDDDFRYNVSATNINGDHVDATVCCGIVKSCTVRY
jgi:hypothetical protein